MKQKWHLSKISNNSFPVSHQVFPQKEELHLWTLKFWAIEVGSNRLPPFLNKFCPIPNYIQLKEYFHFNFICMPKMFAKIRACLAKLGHTNPKWMKVQTCFCLACQNIHQIWRNWWSKNHANWLAENFSSHRVETGQQYITKTSTLDHLQKDKKYLVTEKTC